MNSNSSNENLVFLDYQTDKGNNTYGHIEGLDQKIINLERKISNIENILWENRETYSKSLDILANRELNINQIVVETRKILEKNRDLHSQAFNAVIKKEEELETMIEDLKLQQVKINQQIQETKSILSNNRKIYSNALSEIHDVEVANGKSIEQIQENTPIFLGPASALNPLLLQLSKSKK